MMLGMMLGIFLAGCKGGEDSDAPGSALADEYPLSDPDLYPEGGVFDPGDGAFYVGSLGKGDVTRVDVDGTETIFDAGTGEEDRLTLGIEVDAVRRRLAVCTILNGETRPGRVWIYDLETGEKIQDVDLSAAFAGASCNDIAIDPADGRLYVTDRENPNLYLVDPDSGSATLWETDPMMEPEVIGMNGIAILPDRSAMLVVKYLPARVLRLPFPSPGAPVEIPLSGDPFEPGDDALSGADGIELHGSDLVVAFNAKVFRLVPDGAGWNSAVVTEIAREPGVTAVTVAGDDVYGITGNAVPFVLGQAPSPFRIFRLP